MNLTNLAPVLVATVAPALIILAIAYPLRPQGGRLRARPVPARRLLARCAVDRELGLIPDDEWGDVSRPSLWTVPAPARADLAVAR